jgi:hypothetical protein
MRRRPWPIVILALLQILSPVLSVTLSAWKLQVPIRHFVWMLAKYGTPGQLFELVGTSLIAAAAIFAVKRWSYPVFLTIVAWGAYSNISVWHQYPQVYSLTTLILVNVVNLGLVSYFLVPVVSAAYFNPRLRWWESKPRFSIELVCSMKINPPDAPGSRFCEARITDISEGGVYLYLREKLSLGEIVALNFSLHHVKLSPVGKIVHQGRGEGQGYGVQFVEMAVEEHRALKRAIRGLELLGYERRTPIVPWWLDFYRWATRLLRTGEGLLPEVAPRPAPKLRAVEPVVENGKDDVSKAA